MAAAYTMLDAQYAHHDQQQQPTQLAKQIGVQHLCDHRCQVQHMFGNAFRCDTSGQVHICDANCTQRVYNDRYSMICRISRRVFVNQAVQPLPCRKRACAREEEEEAGACCKRGAGAPSNCQDAAAFYCMAMASQEDAMVM